MFDTTGSILFKLGHPSFLETKEATQEAIARLLDKPNDRHASIALHSDRPGYDLVLLHIGIPGEEQKQMKRSPHPFSVIVDAISGDEGMSELLRGDSREIGVMAGDPADLEKKRKAYESSKASIQDDSKRLTFLRQARVNAIISGTFEQ